MPLPFILGGAALAAAGFGAKKGYDGYQDKSRADDIVKAAKSEYNSAVTALEKANASTQERLEELGELQLKIGNDFNEFQNLAEELIEKINQSREGKNLKISLPDYKVRRIQSLALNSVAYLGKLAGGAISGGAAAYAVYGGTMALAAASTGTSIATLSGAAAYNATMAAIGGGSLAAGGFGMAGGAMVLSGIVAAPLIVAAGWAFASYAENALDNAYSIRRDVKDYVEKSEAACQYHKKTREYIADIYATTNSIYRVFKEYLSVLKLAEESDAEFADHAEDYIIQKIDNGYMVAAILTDIITTPIFKIKTKDGEPVLNEEGSMEFETDENGMQLLNDAQMQNALDSASSSIKQYQ